MCTLDNHLRKALREIQASRHVRWRRGTHGDGQVPHERLNVQHLRGAPELAAVFQSYPPSITIWGVAGGSGGAGGGGGVFRSGVTIDAGVRRRGGLLLLGRRRCSLHCLTVGVVQTEDELEVESVLEADCGGREPLIIIIIF